MNVLVVKEVEIFFTTDTDFGANRMKIIYFCS